LLTTEAVVDETVLWPCAEKVRKANASAAVPKKVELLI
jgi:hypothetical protein